MRRRCVCKYGDAGLPYVIDIQEEQMDYKIIIDSCGDLPEGSFSDAVTGKGALLAYREDNPLTGVKS